MLKNLYTIIGGGTRYWLFIILACVSATIQAGAVLVLFPIFEHLLSDSPATAGPWVAMLLVLIALAAGADILNARVGLNLGISVMRTIHTGLPKAVLAAQEAPTPERVARLRALASTEAIQATSGLLLLLSPLISAVVFMVALSVGLVWVHPVIAAVTAAGGVLVLGALWASTRWEAAGEKRFSDAVQELDSRLFEFAWAQPSLRTARRISAGRRAVDRAIAATRVGMLRVLAWQVPSQLVFSVVLQLVLLGFVLASWWAYSTGRVTGVGAAALVIVLLRIIEQVSIISGSVSAVLLLRRALEEVRDLVRVRPLAPFTPLEHAPTVSVQDLSFTYPDGTVGLESVSLDLRPGTVTVVVGSSGSGKTTLLHILGGLLAPNTGQVLLDKAPADPDMLSGAATVVFQRVVLGAGSIRDNILATNPRLTDAELERIGSISRVDELVQELPHGWDTPVGQWGSQLSGGQRQRVGIARALAKPARLLLIDEATSGLDTRSEHAVVMHSAAFGRITQR